VKAFRIFLLILIIIGLVLIFTQNIWVPKLVNRIISSESVPAVVKETETLQANPFTILIVPGHDINAGGTSFRGIYERDLVVDVADDISLLLSQDPKYKIIVARDKQTWNPIFADYFASNRQAIIDFKNQHQVAYKLLVSSGQEKVVPDMGEHTLATPKTAIELYGINKWADENNVDLIINLHFNNSKRKNVKLPGEHSGFDMFIPERQSVNAATSRTIAEDVYNELKKKFKPEAPGYYNSLFEDQSLIALGASNTLTKPSMLIEYGYIYEKKLLTVASRKQTLEQMAEQTVAGIQDYVNSIER
jgi:N-acetylmuramoyl-L-alanine amidase